MPGKLMDEHACAVLALTTRLAWNEELPKLLSRSMMRQMLSIGALEGLVLRSVPGIQEEWLERARQLLVRVGSVYDLIEAYREAGYDLLFPGREGWPSALDVLGLQTPLFLFVRGNNNLINSRKIAVAGSRRILRETRGAAEAAGRMIAEEGMTLVTGGASGVDSAALHGAIDAGGNAIIVPAMPVAQLMENPLMSRAYAQGNLLFLSDALPDEPFSAAKALERNHTIYALSSGALVIAAREGIGGSWKGAVSCLRGGWRPVYVWDGENADTVGNRALERLGARQFGLAGALKPQLNAVEQTSFLI